jgi:predicted secreted protein
MSNADIGYDTRFAIEDAVGSGVYVELLEVFEVTPPEISVDQVEVTHFKSPGRAKEYIPALSDNGTAQAQMNYLPNSTSDQRLRTLQSNGDVVSMRITFPNGVTVTFPGSVESYSQSVPVNDRMTATAGFKVSGAVVVAAASS